MNEINPEHPQTERDLPSETTVQCPLCYVLSNSDLMLTDKENGGYFKQVQNYGDM